MTLYIRTCTKDFFEGLGFFVDRLETGELHAGVVRIGGRLRLRTLRRQLCHLRDCFSIKAVIFIIPSIVFVA